MTKPFLAVLSKSRVYSNKWGLSMPTNQMHQVPSRRTRHHDPRIQMLHHSFSLWLIRMWYNHYQKHQRHQLPFPEAHKGLFETKQVLGKTWIDRSSFEKWYANQVKYHKVTGEEPGIELKAISYSDEYKYITGRIKEIDGMIREILQAA